MPYLCQDVLANSTTVYDIELPLNICAIRTNPLEPRSHEEREERFSFVKADKNSRPSPLRG